MLKNAVKIKISLFINIVRLNVYFLINLRIVEKMVRLLNEILYRIASEN